MSKKPLILFSLLLAAFVINLDTTIVNVALPTLVRELDASNTQLQWVVDAFNLFFAATVLAAGSLSDRFGRKGMLLAGLVVFGLSSLVGGLMDSPDRLIAARAVMGVGAAMVFPATLSLLTNVFTERRERALAIGLWGAITGAAIALGPIVGGWLLEFSDWRSIFFAMTPIAAIAGVLVAGYVPPRATHAHPGPTAPASHSPPRPSDCSSTRSSRRPTSGWASARDARRLRAERGARCGIRGLGTAHRGADARPEPVPQPALHRCQRAVAISFFALSGFIFLVTQYFQFLKGYGAALDRRAPAPGRRHRRGLLDLGDQARGADRDQAGRRGRAVLDGGASTSGSTTTPHHELRDDRRADGRARHRNGPHQRARDRGDHGRRPEGESRRRLGGQRRHPAARRHPRRRRDRQRLRLALRQPAHERAPRRGAGHRRRPTRTESVGAALTVAGELGHAGHPALAAAVHDAASSAFFHGFHAADYVAAGVAAAGALMALALLPAHPTASTDDTRDTQAPSRSPPSQHQAASSACAHARERKSWA